MHRTVHIIPYLLHYFFPSSSSYIFPFSSFTAALLCGLNGFTVFLEPNWIGEIASWQNKITGCYEYFGTDDDNGNDQQLREPSDQRQQRKQANHRRHGQGQEQERQTSNKRIRQQRSVQQLDDKCSDHMSGLAAAAFGLFANGIQRA